MVALPRQSAGESEGEDEFNLYFSEAVHHVARLGYIYGVAGIDEEELHLEVTRSLVMGIGEDADSGFLEREGELMWLAPTPQEEVDEVLGIAPSDLGI